MAEHPQTESLQQHNIDHFNGAQVKPHMLALADGAAQHILQHIPVGLDSTVLEFGCGLGLISERLAPKVGSVTGVDIAPNMVEVGGSTRATYCTAATWMVRLQVTNSMHVVCPALAVAYQGSACKALPCCLHVRMSEAL
jgi:SAM-dependent methyltransferase